MARASTFITDAIGEDEPVIPLGQCSEVTIFEDAGGATGAYTVREPHRSSPAVIVPPGGSYVFRALRDASYQAGQPVGFVAALVGSLTMDQVER